MESVQPPNPHGTPLLRILALLAFAIIIAVLSSLGTYWYLNNRFAQLTNSNIALHVGEPQSNILKPTPAPLKIEPTPGYSISNIPGTNLKKFTSNDLKISFNYPQDYSIDVRHNPIEIELKSPFLNVTRYGYDLLPGEMDIGLVFDEQNAFVWPNRHFNSLDEYVNYRKSISQGLKVITSSYFLLDGVRAYKQIVKDEQHSETSTSIEVTSFYRNQTVAIGGGIYAQPRSADFDNLISSFKFL